VSRAARAALAVACSLVATALAGCGGAASPARGAVSPVALPRPPHAQFFRRLTTAQRRAAFDAFVARNPGGWSWEGPEQVDAFDGHLVAAHRTGAAAAARTTPLAEGELETASLHFLERNADLFGLASGDLVKLDVETMPRVGPEGAVAGPEGAPRPLLVRAELPMRGYLAFPSVASHVRVLLSVGPGGEVRSFANASTMHPRLALGLDPALGPDDPRVTSRLLGRRVFALLVPTAASAEAVASEPELQARLPRIELGAIGAADVRRVRLDVHVSEAPMGAWRTYRLVWAVEVTKRRPDSDTEAAAFFTFLVDADTGELVLDARVPILEGEP
jgi:hypothetical protein